MLKLLVSKGNGSSMNWSERGEGRRMKWKLPAGVSRGDSNGVAGTFHPKINYVAYKEKKKKHVPS